MLMSVVQVHLSPPDFGFRRCLEPSKPAVFLVWRVFYCLNPLLKVAWHAASMFTQHSPTDLHRTSPNTVVSTLGTSTLLVLAHCCRRQTSERSNMSGWVWRFLGWFNFDSCDVQFLCYCEKAPHHGSRIGQHILRLTVRAMTPLNSTGRVNRLQE